MAYNSNTPRVEYTASATQTVFPFLFKIFAISDIKVYQTLAGATPDDTADILVLTTDYTVTINGDSGGEVILNTGASVNDKITLVRNLSVIRATEYQQNGDLLASTLNSDQEYQTYLIADNASNESRYIKIPNSAQNISTSLPAPIGDSYLKWNSACNEIENNTAIPDAVTTSTSNAAAALASKNSAQLFEWEAEAERLTADSYATEAENTFVNLVTSDGDGTFTYTPTTDYSALHWAAKSMAGDISPIIHAASSKTTPVDADELGIADSAATFSLKKLTWANIKATLASLFAPIASPAFTGTPTAPTAAAGTNTTQVATTAFVMANTNILAEFTVTGSAVTSIDFAGLDINAHGGSYEIEIRLINPTASNGTLSLYMNNDTIATNYYSQFLIGYGASTGAALQNNANIADFTTSQSSSHYGILSIAGTRATFHNRGERGVPSGLILQNYSVVKTAAVTNITQLTFIASVASSIGIGSKIIIRRKDK